MERQRPKQNEVIQYPGIFSDDKFKLCMALAIQSKGDQRYGSLLVKNTKILGKGFNRAISHPSFGRLERHIRQGYANHAEVEAMDSAIDKNHRIKGASIYVAGFFPKEAGLLFLHEEFTCLRCTIVMQKYEIDTLFVPSLTGWLPKKVEELADEARKYVGGTYQNRINSISGNWKMSDFVLSQS